MIRFSPLAVLVLVLVLAPGLAAAHGIGVEAKLKGGTVRVEAFYDDNTAASEAAVTVADASGKVIAEGTTDTAGAWSFPAPPPGKYKVTADAGFGHLAKTTVEIPTLAVPGGTPAAHPEVVVSDGPTREEATGVQRLWMAVAGVAGIAALTAGLYWFSRRRTEPV